MSKRYVLAMMRHETNTFSPLPTELRHFSRGSEDDALLSGQDAIDAYQGTTSPFAGFYDLIKDEAEIDVPCTGNAWPSGKVAASAYENMAQRILSSVEKGCDAVFLDLHGAMVAENYDDAEGELVRRIRSIAPDMPIGVALDFHTNLSSALMDNATVVTGYCTYPHVDTYETAQRAARTLLRAMNGEIDPVISWGVLPMLSHMLRQTPSQQPMKDIMDLAMAAEANGEVLNASVFGGFPLADIPHVGLSAVVVSDRKKGGGPALRDELLAMAWDRREDFVFHIEPTSQTISRAKKLDGGPIVIADHGDNCGAGGTTDVMAVLEEVMAQGLENVAAGPFCDPSAVQELINAGEGTQVTLRLGGKWDMPALGLKGKPLTVTGTVTKITGGRFKVTGPMFTGVTMSIGATAVLDTGTVEIVVCSQPFEPFDLGPFTHAGIDPTEKKYLLIKSRQHFRAGFEPIAEHILLVDGPGVCSSDYSLFNFENIGHPIYPLDPNTPKSIVGN